MPFASDSIRDDRWLRAQVTAQMPATLFIFGRPQALASVVAGRLKLVELVARYALAAGLDVELVGEPHADTRFAQDSHHMRLYLADRAVYAPNTFHSVSAYLRGYAYFEETGTRNNSSIRLKTFDPSIITPARAVWFADRLRDQFVARNQSKMKQSAFGQHPVEPGALVVFAQDFAPPRWHRHYLTVPRMIEAVIAARGSHAVFIKPHPKNDAGERAQLQALHDPQNGVHITDASLHDLLAAAACAISLTSACCFEAFLHHTPAVVCGQTDFHHNAVTLTGPAKMAEAIAAATSRQWPYDQYLAWFLQDNCVEDAEAGLPVALDRMYRKGFSWADPTGRGFA